MEASTYYVTIWISLASAVGPTAFVLSTGLQKYNTDTQTHIVQWPSRFNDDWLAQMIDLLDYHAYVC